MRRDAKPSKVKVQSKPPGFKKSRKDPGGSAAELKKQLEEVREQQTATGEILRAIASTPTDIRPVFQAILANATRLCNASVASLWLYDGEVLASVAHQNASPEFADYLSHVRARPGPETTTRRAALERRTIQVANLSNAPGYSPTSFHREENVRTVLSVPLLRENVLVGVITLWRREMRPFSDSQVVLVETFADQAVIAIQNARLFSELQAKSSELEAASRHKSEFLANMSHELRTPLNAIIGFSEILSEKMFGEINAKQAEYLHDILESGRHLLSLINDILDLSKIEAGRMELEATDFDLPNAIESALMLVRERAGRNGVRLQVTVDARLGTIRGDERKVKQVLLNLLSNALKFTPEGGQVDVQARVHDGAAQISITDTGVGIAPEDQEAVFEEFRQVGTAAKKAEGTGLGLAISRKIIELHGGRIWVASRLGIGSTFAFALPLTYDCRHAAE